MLVNKKNSLPLTLPSHNSILNRTNMPILLVRNTIEPKKLDFKMDKTNLRILPKGEKMIISHFLPKVVSELIERVFNYRPNKGDTISPDRGRKKFNTHMKRVN